MKFLVVDGLADIRQQYCILINKLFPYAQVVESISAEDALFTYFEENPDLIIASDVLSYRSAGKLSAAIYKINKKTPVVVIANDDTNAIEAIKSNCFDFLLAPVSENDFENSINKAIDIIESNVQQNTQEYFADTKVKLSEGRGIRMLDLNKIACFLADGSYSKIVFSNGDIEFSGYFLGKIDLAVSNNQFVRISRSALVNMNFFKFIDRVNGLCILELENSTMELKISKRQIRKLEEENVL
jgi:DNA-binding LytR/AlgR family response regulator